MCLQTMLTDAPASQAPQLANPMQWQAYIQQSFGSAERQVGPVNLLQMDIAVRDPRSDEPGNDRLGFWNSGL